MLAVRQPLATVATVHASSHLPRSPLQSCCCPFAYMAQAGLLLHLDHEGGHTVGCKKLEKVTKVVIAGDPKSELGADSNT